MYSGGLACIQLQVAMPLQFLSHPENRSSSRLLLWSQRCHSVLLLGKPNVCYIFGVCKYIRSYTWSIEDSVCKYVRTYVHRVEFIMMEWI